MKKGLLLIPIVAGLAYVTLSSNSTGYVANVSGSAGTASCGGGGCHGTAATSTIIDSVALDSAGVLVNKYTPGMSYTLRFGAVNMSSSTLPKFGFQLSVVNAAGTANAGTMTAITGTSLSTFGSIKVLGHTAPLAPTTGTGGMFTVYSVAVPWTAPAAGTGSVKVYGILNAVDGDGNATSGDKWNAKSATIAERTSTPPAQVTEVAHGLEIAAFPNPVQGHLHVQLANASGIYNVRVFDMNGKVVAAQAVEANGTTIASVNMSQMATGVYHIAVEQNGVVKTTTVTKQ